jgi:Zn-dependent peptidase ImmA (M78 family)
VNSKERSGEGVDARVGTSRSAHPITQQRYSMAHEIAHLVLHRHRLMFVDKLFRVTVPGAPGGPHYPREEVEANGFAAALLMPAAMIDVAMSRSIRGVGDKDNDALIEELARRFQVSSQAMEYRLTSLGRLIPR